MSKTIVTLSEIYLQRIKTSMTTPVPTVGFAVRISVHSHCKRSFRPVGEVDLAAMGAQQPEGSHFSATHLMTGVGRTETVRTWFEECRFGVGSRHFEPWLQNGSYVPEADAMPAANVPSYVTGTSNSRP